MIARKFMIIAVVGGVIFSIVPSWLYASGQDNVIESVGQLYEIILNGPKEKIIESAEYALEHGPKGGGYIFSSSNTIFKGIPLENYELMLDVFRRKFPIK